MPMTGAGMKAAVLAALAAEFGSDYDNIADDHTLGGYDQATYWSRYWGAASDAIVAYIQGNALVTTNDAQGGTNTGTVS